MDLRLDNKDLHSDRGPLPGDVHQNRGPQKEGSQILLICLRKWPLNGIEMKK